MRESIFISCGSKLTSNSLMEDVVTSSQFLAVVRQARYLYSEVALRKNLSMMMIITIMMRNDKIDKKKYM